MVLGLQKGVNERWDNQYRVFKQEDWVNIFLNQKHCPLQQSYNRFWPSPEIFVRLQSSTRFFPPYRTVEDRSKHERTCDRAGGQSWKRRSNVITCNAMSRRIQNLIVIGGLFLFGNIIFIHLIFIHLIFINLIFIHLIFIHLIFIHIIL